MRYLFISGGEIVLFRDVQKGAPGLRTDVRFRAGQVVYVGVIYYPGMRARREPETQWKFWTDSDVDSAIIFDADEVGELRIQERYFADWRPIFNGLKADLPFAVSMIRADGSIEPKYPAQNSAPTPPGETTRVEPMAPIETDLSGFTENEIGMSEMIVERCAGQLPAEEQALLLHHLRTFAGTVAARHYIYGSVDGRKTAEKESEATIEKLSHLLPYAELWAEHQHGSDASNPVYGVVRTIQAAKVIVDKRTADKRAATEVKTDP